MSLFSPKYLFLAVFCTVLIGCSKDKPSAQQQCQYKSEPQQQLKMSTFPEKQGLAFSQEKLIELMWTSLPQSECFLRKNGNVNLYKTLAAQNDSTQNFVQLKAAPLPLQTNWNESESELKKMDEDSILLGLTTLSFFPPPQERLARIDIVVRIDGRPWHLWNEYAHFLLGEFRVKNPKLVVRHVNRMDVEKAYEEMVAVISKSEDFQKKFNMFSDLQFDYIQKNYVDEILIEQTIQDLVSQTSLLPANQDDFAESQGVIDRFSHRYINYYFDQQAQINELMSSLSTEQMGIVQVHIKRLEQQNFQLLGLTP